MKLQKLLNVACDSVNATKSKLLMFERGTNTEYAMRLNGKRLKNFGDFKYLDRVTNKKGRLMDKQCERV